MTMSDWRSGLVDGWLDGWMVGCMDRQGWVDGVDG